MGFIIKENYCYPEQSMMDLLGIDNDWYAGSPLEEQVRNGAWMDQTLTTLISYYPNQTKQKILYLIEVHTHA